MWARIVLLERIFCGIINRVKNTLFIGKADLDLCRMNVDVHRFIRHVQMQHAGRKLSHHNRVAIGLLQSSHSGAAFDEPAIEEEKLHCAVWPRGQRLCGKTGYTHAAQLIIHREQTRGEILPYTA